MESQSNTPASSTHPEVIEKSSILVDFSGPDDNLNAQNWPNLKKSVYPFGVHEATLTFETQVLYLCPC